MKRLFGVPEKNQQTYIKPLAKLPNKLFLLLHAAQIVEGKLFEPIDDSSKKNFIHLETGPFTSFKK